MEIITGEHRKKLDADKAIIEEQDRKRKLADPLARAESEDTDIDAEAIGALRKEVLRYTDTVVEGVRQKLTLKVMDSSDRLAT